MTAQTIKKVVSHLKNVPDEKFVSVVDYLDFLAEKEENYELTPAGKELLKRIQDGKSGKAKFLTTDDVFDV